MKNFISLALKASLVAASLLLVLLIGLTWVISQCPMIVLKILQKCVLLACAGCSIYLLFVLVYAAIVFYRMRKQIHLKEQVK